MNIRTIPGLLVLAALAHLAFSSVMVAAQEGTPIATTAALPPDEAVGGLGLAEWSARSWQWFFSFPPETNPVTDETGDRCGLGQSGPVSFLAGAEHSLTRTCVVPLGVHIFVPLLGSECSTVEPPPFFGLDETELSRCAADAVNMAEGAFDMSTMRVTVDGQSVDDLSSYRARTPLMSLWLPEDNLLGSPQRVADSVADGYQVLLSPLAEGDHEVIIALPGPEPVEITYRLTVVSGASSGS